jgi:chromosome partitioning protein
MKTIAVLSRKGGAGKTTLCVHLAVAAENRGIVTAIMDLDPQASAAVWGDNRGEAPDVVPAQAPRLAGLLSAAKAQGCKLALLDTAPHADGIAADAAALADAVVIPCRPSSFDLAAIGSTVRLAQAAGKPAYVVINAAPTQGRQAAETAEALTKAGVQVSPIVIHQRVALAWPIANGRTANEAEPSGKAAQEIAALLDWLATTINLPKIQSANL